MVNCCRLTADKNFKSKNHFYYKMEDYTKEQITL